MQDPDAPQDNIWGTTVNVPATQKRIREFFDKFETADGIRFYHAQMDELRETDSHSLNLNCANLYSFDRELYMQMSRYPTEVHPLRYLTAL